MSFKLNTHIDPKVQEIIVLQQFIHSYNHLVKLVTLPSTHIMRYEMTGDLVNIYMVINAKKSLFYPEQSNRQLIESVLHQTKGLTCLL